MSEKLSFLELRPDDRGKFDELVGGPCMVHFEMLDGNLLWISLEKDPNTRVVVTVSAKGKLTVTADDDR
jgi:hypothetical protein